MFELNEGGWQTSGILGGAHSQGEGFAGGCAPAVSRAARRPGGLDEGGRRGQETRSELGGQRCRDWQW